MQLPAKIFSYTSRGGALIPGLVDHHIHLMATAARRHVNPDGLSPTAKLADQFFTEDTPGMLGTSEARDEFGRSLG